MDYEKKYKEALELARVAAFNGHQSLMEGIFPELAESEDEKIRKELIDIVAKSPITFAFEDKNKVLSWLEKQDTERKQLYVRFGDIPSNEKSKIYHGEEEIGDENGVSVYPAFELNGNIVLGLTLPITKTTLYTQQHLLEYDNRPCYLVSGDYVGKGTDGEPLIKNISVIKRLDNYRIKECEKKPAIEMKSAEESLGIDSETYNKIVDECIYGDDKQKSADKIELKFKVGDWVVSPNGVYWHIDVIQNGRYEVTADTGQCADWPLDTNIYRLWTIQDAKEGDVLATDNDSICIFDGTVEEGKYPFAYCGISMYGFRAYDGKLPFTHDEVYPATKEQRDLLFKKMKDAGYEWDAEKKELKIVDWSKHIKYNPNAPSIIKENPSWSEEDDKMYNSLTEFEKAVKQVMEEAIECGDTHNLKADADMLLRLTQKPWSEEDETRLQVCLDTLQVNSLMGKVDTVMTNWLKSLKNRIKGE